MQKSLNSLLEPGELEAFLNKEVPFPLLRFDSCGRLLFANVAAAPILRAWTVSVGEIIQDPWKRRIVLTGRSRRDRSYDISAGDFSFKVYVSSSPLGTGVTITGQDVTVDNTLKEISDQARSTREGTSRLAALGEMAAGVAHEINNPLAIIQGYAERLSDLCKTGTHDQGEISRIAERISDTTMRAAKIVSTLLKFARGPTSEKPEHSAIQPIVEMAATFCGHRLSRALIELEVRLPSDPIAIECFPVQISQVLVNLLNNAHDAVARLDERWIKVHTSIVGKHVEIRVSDSGRMPASVNRSRLFQPFYSTKPAGLGTGLGLSISSNIIESHGGTLSLDDSEENTTFVIRLPMPSSDSEKPTL
ncbi:MAG: GHKL domain-containing protein [Bdellovibrionales bacterium]|nr:GHKL domain-containing protein [Bdellovibrionales bacterium]